MLRVSIAGGSGYAGGELLRLLLAHPEVEVGQVTSERLAGKPVTRAHPNLRGRTPLKFSPMAHLEACDVLFLCLPHGDAIRHWDRLGNLGDRVIDLSADFRLREEELNRRFYPDARQRPDESEAFVYGIPELSREAIRESRHVACAGCNATAVILALYPLFHARVAEPGSTVVEVKAGSSEAGHRSGEASHHPVRTHCLRSFRPTGHRHVGEIEQALSLHEAVQVFFSATAVDLVRGILATCHVFLKEDLDEKAIWKLYRKYYGEEPFIRIVKAREGVYRYPEPKILAGTNYCDIGFEREEGSRRLVVISAIDNLMKGAAGQAMQNMNIMCGFPETLAMEFAGLHPV
ncbi:MAG: N-acetyl-gamma-glutamyl-phosphate reductase [Planctomycetota bacterium]|jgi:N-acetyl-gamma-glutamyl-phosphate/LysW-gamma-L-alpha-aminoadipyl-6-phosphate reductase